MGLINFLKSQASQKTIRMALYNAVIRGENNEILGRTKISPRTKLPASLKMTYQKEEVFPWETKFLLCDSSHPLIISRRKLASNISDDFDQPPFFIFLDFNNSIDSYRVTCETTVSDLKKAICKRKPIPFSGQKLLYGNKLLEDDKKLREDYNIVDNSIVTLLCKIKGGAGRDLSILDLESERKYGTGHSAERNWWSFSRGLNVMGICRRESCPSRTEGVNKRHPTINLGYGFYSFQENILWCPACDDFTMIPINILVSGGRSHIRFRRSVANDDNDNSNGNPIKTTFLESQDDFPNYVEISEEDSVVIKYYLVEITTTKLHESAFDCNLCAHRIGLKNDEHERECGHYFHKACSEQYEFCPVCRAQLVADTAVAICLSFCGDEGFIM